MSEVVRSIISQSFIAGENPGNLLLDGNILDNKCVEFQRLKQLGSSPCQDCVFFDPSASLTIPYSEQLCAHRNLLGVLEKHDVLAANTVMVSFGGAGEIGMYDKEKSAGNVTEHPFGWEMIKGYNAFFALTEEVEAIGGRAADCSVVRANFKLPNGKRGLGLIHLTRDNLQGDGALTYGPNGGMSYLTDALLQAAHHYGVELSDFELTQMAKIDKLDYRFAPIYDKESGELLKTAEQVMDERFAGWFDMGMLHNLSNPTWKRGDPIDPKDEWRADYQEMTEHVILASGVPSDQIDVSEAINPGDVSSGHASNAAANDPNRPKELRRPDSRDLYMVKDAQLVRRTLEREQKMLDELEAENINISAAIGVLLGNVDGLELSHYRLARSVLVETHAQLHAASAGARAGYKGYQLPTVSNDIRFGLVHDILERGMPAYQVAMYERLEASQPKVIESVEKILAEREDIDAKHVEVARVVMLITYDMLYRQREADKMAARMAGRIITRSQMTALQDYLFNSQLVHDEPDIRMYNDEDTAELHGLVLVD